jgi:predicted AlkP superfamily pyrophosphatase or phosphodiesterase
MVAPLWRSTRAALVATAVVLPASAAQAPPSPPYRLVLHLAVDQLRPDYLVRWERELTGGLGRLLREGTFYVAGEQDHAITETAPGHASMLSGRWPARTGIVSNDRGVFDPAAPLIGVGGPGASPHRFRGTALYDWMRAADPETRVLSVSRKDRGAILPIGRAAVPVYWWAGEQFTTSRWYATQLPEWLVAWNATRPVERLAGWSWSPLPGVTYAEPDHRPYEAGGEQVTFPHRLSDSVPVAARQLLNTPPMDSLTLDVAWHGLKALGLGRRDGTDLLAISLSTTDAVGHAWGPGSLELHDQVRRLDRYLGAFLDSLATVVPLERVLISLTSDHGVQEFPEGVEGGGRASLRADARALQLWAQARFNLGLDIGLESGLLLADTRALTARGVDVNRLADSLAAVVAARPGVRRVFTPGSLAATGDAEAMMWRRQIAPDTDWLIAVALERGWMWTDSPNYTTHGTTNLLDVRVPIIFRVPGVAARRVDRPVGVVDIGPTHAALLGIDPTEPLDGRPLPELVPPRRP